MTDSPGLALQHVLTDELIGAFVDWDFKAAHPPKFLQARWLEPEARRKEDAIKALGLDGCWAHRTIAGRRKGMSIPDAVQTVILEQHALREAS